jgi:ferritin-like metal-binding protein YciE
MKLRTLDDLLVLKLKALYDIEDRLTKALPKMAKAATDPDLKKGFEDHLKETKNHSRRLEQAFQTLGLKPSKTKAEGIRGIIADAEWNIKEKPSKEALDALLIASASYAEHYEMAGYMAASNWANALGYTEVSSLLRENLAEEQAADAKMADLAKRKVDARAMVADEA